MDTKASTLLNPTSSLTHAAVIKHMERTGRALQSLWDAYRYTKLFTSSEAADRIALRFKTKALVKHDRIMRGEA